MLEYALPMLMPCTAAAQFVESVSSVRRGQSKAEHERRDTPGRQTHHHDGVIEEVAGVGGDKLGCSLLGALACKVQSDGGRQGASMAGWLASGRPQGGPLERMRLALAYLALSLRTVARRASRVGEPEFVGGGDGDCLGYPAVLGDLGLLRI